MFLLTPLKYMILSSAVTTLIFGFIFLFVSIQENAVFMRIWGICWIVYFITFVADVVYLGTPTVSSLYILLKQLFSLIAAFLFLSGTYSFFHLNISYCTLIISAISFLSILTGIRFHTMFHGIYGLILIPNVLISTTLVAWAGCIFYLYTWTQNIPEKYLLCFLIILWSICNNNFTFLLPELSLSILNYFGSLLILNITIIFLLIVYFKKIYYLLNVQETRFRLLVENATEHIFLFDYLKHHFEYISPSAANIFGFTISELKKDVSNFLKYLPEEDKEKIYYILNYPPNGSSMETFQVLKETQEPIWCEIHYTPIFNDNGDIIALEWILRDISSRKKIEQELREAENMKRELLENIAHEIRTPITLIMGYAESILNHVVSESNINSYLKNIYSKAELLNTLVNDFMNASSPNAQTMEFRFYEINAKQFFENILSQCEHHIITSGMRFICDSNIAENIFLVVDSARIEQVFSNLVSNALRYAYNGTTITITISTSEITSQTECNDADIIPVGEIIVKVMDDGNGIDEKDLPYLFQRKYRGSSNTSGSGLGLFISKQIITQHSGKIWAKNAELGGSIFCFTLPYYLDYDNTEKNKDIF